MYREIKDFDKDRKQVYLTPKQIHDEFRRGLKEYAEKLRVKRLIAARDSMISEKGLCGVDMSQFKDDDYKNLV